MEIVRPSSVERAHRLRVLVAEFAARDMGYLGVAAFLNCSNSAARNYVHALQDERIIVPAPGVRAAPIEERTVFRLNPDPVNFVQTERINDEAPRMPVRRDPLVAALFGNARSDQP